MLNTWSFDVKSCTFDKVLPIFFKYNKHCYTFKTISVYVQICFSLLYNLQLGHLADAFIQSDLHRTHIECSTFSAQGCRKGGTTHAVR
jgi:hypothetical protein